MTEAGFHLRTATADDLPAILAIERASETAPHWPESTYAAILAPASGPRRCIFVATHGRLAGFAVGAISLGTPAELETVAVAPSARRMGIGRALCIAVLDWCRANGASEVELEVRESSQEAIALYTSLGFTAVGRRLGYYSDPDDDALLMGIVF